MIDEKIYIFKTKKNRFIIFFTMLCSIIAIIYYFTFGITGLSDNYKEQLYLINNFSKISDSIPIAQNIYVIFINCIIEHQIDILLIYYSQVIVYGLLLSYLLFKLYKNGINKFAFYFSLLLSLFNPLIYYNLFSISEHVTAALFLLLYICYIFKNGFKYNISFVLINIAFVTFVNYGLLLIVLALYDFVFIKNYRKTSVKLISFIIVFYIIFTNINSVYYIKRESLLDSPTISHQTARYIAYENLNEIDKLSLGDSYNLNQISKFYNGENLNEIIKYKSNNISIEQKHSAFLSYLKLFKRNPKTAIQGFLNHVSPFFVFGNSNVFFNYKNIPSTFLFVFSPSLYIWALIILIFSIKTSNKKENKHKIALLFIIINVLFSGYSADISISFILYITLPIYIAYCSTKGSHVAQKPNTHQ
ncbi:MAG: hypothetical protein GYA87_02915 [Christensenellaceae bacterium]|nr:hypothetical protein [Christensenellaceae bacterium]